MRRTLCLAVVSACLALSRSPCQAVPAIVGAQALQSSGASSAATSLNLPDGCQLYAYGAATGGARPLKAFSNGQTIQVKDASGYVAAQIAVTTDNRNSFQTETSYHVLGGFGVSGFHYFQGFYDTNPGPGANSASVEFTLSAPAMVAVLGLASSQTALTLSGVDNLVTDVPVRMNTPGTEALTVAHTYLAPGTYTIQEKSASGIEGQDAANQVDLMAVLVFSDSPSTAKSNNPQIPVSVSASQTPEAQPGRATGEQFQLNNGSSVSGSIILFNENSVTLRMSDGTYTNMAWLKFSQNTLKQLAQNPKIKSLVEPFIEKPVAGIATIAGNSETIVGSWNFNVNASIAKLISIRPKISSGEVKALRTLWSDAYAQTVFIATEDHQALLKDVPRFRVERGAVAVAEKMILQGRWEQEGANYNLSFNGNGKKENMIANIDGLQLTLNPGNYVWVFDRGNAPAIIPGSSSSSPGEVVQKPPVSIAPVTPQIKSQPKAPSEKPHIPIIRYLIVGIGILVFAGLAVAVVRLAMPRRKNK